VGLGLWLRWLDSWCRDTIRSASDWVLWPGGRAAGQLVGEGVWVGHCGPLPAGASLLPAPDPAAPPSGGGAQLRTPPPPLPLSHSLFADKRPAAQHACARLPAGFRHVLLVAGRAQQVGLLVGPGDLPGGGGEAAARGTAAGQQGGGHVGAGAGDDRVEGALGPAGDGGSNCQLCMQLMCQWRGALLPLPTCVDC